MPTRSRARVRGAGGVKAAPSFIFTGLTAGPVTLPAGLTLTRASSATVQTGTSVVVTAGIASNQARAGRKLDADSVGLFVECARTNLCKSSEDPTSADYAAGVTVVTTYPDGTAPNGSATTACKHAVTNPGYSRYQAFSATTGVKHTYSMWHQSPSGSITARWQPGAATPTYSCTTAWGRVTGAYTSVGTLHYLTMVITDTQTVRTWGHQVEVGEFPSSYIQTTLGATATRAGERLTITGAVTRGGAIKFACGLRCLGASTEYVTDGATVSVWYVDANNKAQFDTTTLVLTVTIGGATNTCTLNSWTRDQLVELSIVAGGSVATVVKQRVNSGSVNSLTITGSALGAISATSLDVLCESTGKQWSGIVTYLQCSTPAWAA